MFDRKLTRFIKLNFRYVDYLDALGESYKPTNNPDEIRICCPSCGESDYKLYINDEKKTFCCFKCSFGHRGQGDVFDLVANLEDIPVGAALQRLCSDYRSVVPEGLTMEDEEPIAPPSFENIKTIKDLPPCTYQITEEYEDAKPFIDYLLSRGFTVEDIYNTNAHYTGPLTRVKRANGKRINVGNRVLWPVYGGKGDLVSWLSRAISEDPEKKHIKYINCPDTDLSKTFWPFVPLPPGKVEAVACEGLIDALSLRRAGFIAYCCFGKRISEEQVLLLQHWGVTSLTIFFDRDAKREVIKLVDQLRLRFEHLYVVDTSRWPGKQDSGALLANPDGCQILQDTLAKRIDVLDDLAYSHWKVK